MSDELPRCEHGNCLRDGSGELLEPPCGCRVIIEREALRKILLRLNGPSAAQLWDIRQIAEGALGKENIMSLYDTDRCAAIGKDPDDPEIIQWMIRLLSEMLKKKKKRNSK